MYMKHYLSRNTTLSEVNQCVIYAVLTLHVTDEERNVPGKLLAKVKENIKLFKDLLLKYGYGKKSGQDYFLEGIEEVASRHSEYIDVLAKVHCVTVNKIEMFSRLYCLGITSTL